MPPEAPVDALGLIAGKGAYPLELAESARAQGVKRLFAVAFKHETDKAINRLCDEVRWMYVGQLAAFVDAFRASGVRAAVMAGQITPSHLFSLRLDAPMRALLAALPRRNADTIFGAIGDELRKVGVELRPASLFMESRMPGPGVLTARAPTPEERADLDFGFRPRQGLQRESHRPDGRGAPRDGHGRSRPSRAPTPRSAAPANWRAGVCVVVKVAMPGHDMRWDIPVVGLRTLESLRKAGATCLGVEAPPRHPAAARGGGGRGRPPRHCHRSPFAIIAKRLKSR
jgi:DUF1009 family protein